MNLSFDAAIARGYSGPTQKIRNLSEHWAGREIYCVNCDCLRLIRFANNSRAADLYCTDCSEQYELKSAQRPFGRMVGDGAYSAMIQRVSEATGPNLLLLRYDASSLMVGDLFVVPRHFLAPGMIRARKPLSQQARRAGWVGCNIVLGDVPQAGRIYLVRAGTVIAPHDVRVAWRRTFFLREAMRADARGWLLSVIGCIEATGARSFTLQQLYDQEPERLTRNGFAITV